MFKIINHPLIQDKLSKIRDKNTDSLTFCENVEQISQLMVYEATKNLETIEKKIETPLCKTTGHVLKNDINIVPILRAGLGMSNSIKKLIPSANTGHIGLYRNDKNFSTVEYYEKLPKNISKSHVLLLDPMLATGGSLNTAINIIKKHKPISIIYIGILACNDGLNYIQNLHPDISIYICALDKELNKDKYIVPGLGDAGDRIFGTK